MDVLDKFFIKVNSDDRYDINGTFKSLKEIHTKNGKLFPQNPLEEYLHPVIKSFGANPNAYKQVYSDASTKFVNDSKGIDFLFDSLNDAMTPIVSERLYKAGVDYPIMHPYMVAVLDSFAKNDQTRVAIADGSYALNKYGGIDNPLKSAGIIEIQAPGGASGGTNNIDKDSAGAGGGAGAFGAIYYRIKNTDAQVTMNIFKGTAGQAGDNSGIQNGGDATAGKVEFVVNGNASLKYTISAEGGHGGQTGNYDYTAGGAGGQLLFVNSDTGETKTLASAGQGGSESQTPTSGSLATAQVLINNEYILIYLLAGQGGAGGGRGDDTDGGQVGQNGGQSLFISYNFPTSHSKTTEVSLLAMAGGEKGALAYNTQAGGGGASVFASGGQGGAESTNGNPGSFGSGAGGAGVGDNANRAGSKGGDGVIYYYN